LKGWKLPLLSLPFAHKVGLAAIAALAAVAVVTAAGFALRAPLAKVPENTMKFSVGIMLTAFGIFWGAEGSAGASKKWPGDNWALPALILGVTLFSFVLIEVLKVMRVKPRVVVVSKSETSAPAESQPERDKLVAGLIAFGAFWADFIVGDDWRIAAGIVLSFILTATITYSAFTWAIVPLFVAIFLSYSLYSVASKH
jgi:uncharacterized membrane protein